MENYWPILLFGSWWGFVIGWLAAGCVILGAKTNLTMKKES